MRDDVNATFFAAALERGLSAAILNPYSTAMMRTYYTHRLLHGADPTCAEYIAFCERCPKEAVAGTPTATVTVDGKDAASVGELQEAILKGRHVAAGEITRQLLNSRDGMQLVEEEILPALDRVGIGFENKTVYLPQLLMSAEAAKAAFEVIKSQMQRTSDVAEARETILLATVKGDIHDIGKNIVRLLLENYGFSVIDLGRDVDPEEVLRAATERGARIVGLSALMTTTVPAMEETIRLLHTALPDCRVMVGGAVLNEDYAKRICADAYCKDAMAAVRCAEAWCGR
jgi:5-methyltetrahydrofolate--homocysteine methyltransferase